MRKLNFLERNVYNGFILLAVAILSAQQTHAQCNPAISPAALIKNASGSHAGSGAEIWLCPNLTYTISGTGNIIYAEMNCNIAITGNSNKLYMKGPGKLTLDCDMTTGSMIPGDVTFLNLGFNNNFTPCPSGSVTFNYDDAPAPGCTATSVFEMKNSGKTIDIFPNPAADFIRVGFGQHAGTAGYKVLDRDGRTMLEGVSLMVEEKIEVSSLNEGMYIIILNTSEGVKSERFVIAR